MNFLLYVLGKKNRRKALEEIPKTEATKDDDTASQANSSEPCHKKNTYNTTEDAKEEYRDEDRRDGKFSCNTELYLNKEIEVKSNKHIDCTGAAELDKESAEDQYGIDDIVRSFIGIDLNSFCGDDSASMATEGSTDVDCSDQSYKKNSHCSSEAYHILPLRERLERKVLTNKEELRKRVEVNRRCDVEKSESTAVRDAKLTMKVENVSEVNATSTANTSINDEHSFEMSSVLRSKLGNKERRLRITEGFAWKGKSKDCDSEAKFQIRCEDKYLEDKSEREKKSNGELTKPSTERQASLATDDSKNKDYPNFNADKTVSIKDTCRKSDSELIDLTSPSPHKVSSMIPKENIQSNNKETNISDDSLAHLLNDSLFDLPQSLEEIDCLVDQEKTSNVEESVADPRQEISIRKNSAHDERVFITKSSHQGLEGDTEVSWVSLPLIERLKRRLQKD